MLIQGDICAELFGQPPLPGEGEDTRFGDEAGHPSSSKSVADESADGKIPGTGVPIDTTIGANFPTAAEALEKSPEARRRAWTRLKRRILVFPALLEPSTSPQHGHEVDRHAGAVRDGDTCNFVAGRRIGCRSPMLPPGLFHAVQARLANR